jgi:5-formyltetrahydrofolate cyclo-ligase
VAVYLAADGEVDLSGFFSEAQRRGIALYAPLLIGDRLAFRSLEPGSPLTANRFGIPEPTTGAAIDPRSLDLVLTPLVGFDRSGTRLGMGKGYYDRTFRFLRHRRNWLKPKLIGIGFDFQEVSTIATAPWDVPLWGVVTNDGARHFLPESTQ